MSLITAPYGMILVGVFISLFLYGAFVVQVYLYIKRFPGDTVYIKVFVSCLFVVDTFSTIFAIWWIYNLLITNWGNIEPYTVADWLVATVPICSCLIAAMVQSLYAWRIRILSSSNIVPCIVWFCAFVNVCGGLGTSIGALWLVSLDLLYKLRAVILLWLIAAAVGDIIITFAMTYYLRRVKVGYQKTNNIIDKIIRLTIQNGLLTAAFAIADFSTYLATPVAYHIAIAVMMAKVYSNSGISSLNARTALRDRLHGTYVLGEISNSSQGPNETTATQHRNQEVFVHVETRRETDAKLDDNGSHGPTEHSGKASLTEVW